MSSIYFLGTLLTYLLVIASPHCLEHRAPEQHISEMTECYSYELHNFMKNVKLYGII